MSKAGDSHYHRYSIPLYIHQILLFELIRLFQDRSQQAFPPRHWNRHTLPIYTPLNWIVPKYPIHILQIHKREKRLFH